MQRTSVQDTLVGLFVAISIVALFFLSLRVSNLDAYATGGDTYTLIAKFANSGGLKAKSAVSIAGVRIGRIESIHIDPDSFEAVVTMAINRRYNNLPEDTSASVFTAGLLGEQYISLEPGGMPDILKDGDQIELTQSAMVLEQLIGKFLFSKAEENPSE
ncbi:MAG: outer membrane lipid asymmetry maintenance protein MlaD [Methylococcales bacterium]|nr:outer membrane lipid asymmetry maintenance protein MlaD [Methylococcales bacterium]